MNTAHGAAGEDSHGPWWETLFTHWQFDGVAIAGFGLSLLAIAWYLGAVDMLRSSGRRWPMQRTVAFLSGVLVVSLMLQSGIGVYEDIGWVHVLQHMALMAIAAPLIAMGSPIPLALRTCPQRVRKIVLAAVRDPAMRIADSRIGAAFLVLDYFGSMIVYLLTPLYGYSEDHLVVHLLVHVYFLGCGVLFWLPILGRNPTRWRPTRRTAAVVIALGIPVNVLAGALFITAGGALSGDDTLAQTRDVGWALVWAGVVATLFGLALLRTERTTLRRGAVRTAPAYARQL